MITQLRTNKLLQLPRKFIKLFFSSLYPLAVKFYKLPEVASIEDTINIIVEEKLSVSRLGDGEILMIVDKMNFPFQRYDTKLLEKLKAVLKNKNKKLLVCLPIGYQSVEGLKEQVRIMWQSHIVWTYPRFKKYLDFTKIYYNASFTRPYISFNDRIRSEKYFSMIIKIWNKKSILLVEGEKSRLGVGNNLFSNACELKRILAPAHNAFDKYEEIINEIKRQKEFDLILLALGPTATIMAAELAEMNYQAIDIGNIDLEYEWYLRGAKEKVKIPGKYTSEATGGRIVDDIFNIEYEKQIIKKLL